MTKGLRFLSRSEADITGLHDCDHPRRLNWCTATPTLNLFTVSHFECFCSKANDCHRQLAFIEDCIYSRD